MEVYKKKKKFPFPINFKTLIISFFCLLFMLSLITPIGFQKSIIDSYYSKVLDLRNHIGIIIQQFIDVSSDISSDKLQKIQLDINQNNIFKLRKDQKNIVARELEGMGYDFTNVNGKLSIDNKKYSVRLRLKGDTIDHFKRDQWSFRIKVKNEEKINGMKIFSLHHVKHRNYFYEWLLMKTMKREDIIAPKYEFFQLFLNGKKLGTYALEEHFSKEILESNNRREGPIIRIEENYYPKFLMDLWNYEDYDLISKQLQWPHFLFNYSNLSSFENIENINFDKQSKSFLNCKKIFDNYRKGKTTFYETFDSVKIAKHAAISFVFGATHGLDINNQRFYCNTITGKIEPIAFDGDAGLTRLTPKEFYFRLKTILGSNIDEKFYRDLVEQLEIYSDDNFIKTLTNAEDFKSNVSKSLTGFSIDGRENYKIYKEYSSIFEEMKNNDSVFHYNKKIINSLIDPQNSILSEIVGLEDNVLKLKFQNSHPLPIKISKIIFENKNLINNNILIKEANYEFPFNNKNNDEKIVRLKITNNELKNNINSILNRTLKDNDLLDIYFEYSLNGSKNKKKIYRQKINKISDQEFKYFSLETEFDLLDVLTEDAYEILNNKIYILKDVTFNYPVEFPKEYDVVVNPGVNIYLEKSSYLLIRSNLLLNGTSNQPIKISSIDQSGNGLIITGFDKSTIFKYVEVSNLSTIDYDYSKGLNLTGPITFYETNMHLNNVVMQNNKSGDDILNIIKSKFYIENSMFVNSLSDALDIDFSNGKILNSKFFNCGKNQISNDLDNNGDCIDFSGSNVELENIIVKNAGDKAVSVGENSRVSISNINIKNANYGLVSKDNSVLKSNNVSMENLNFGLAAYKKKNEYGPGKIISNINQMINIKNTFYKDLNSIIQAEGKFQPNNYKDFCKKIRYSEIIQCVIIEKK